MLKDPIFAYASLGKTGVPLLGCGHEMFQNFLKIDEWMHTLSLRVSFWKGEVAISHSHLLKSGCGKVAEDILFVVLAINR